MHFQNSFRFYAIIRQKRMRSFCCDQVETKILEAPRDFERANQQTLEGGVHNRDELVFPQRALFRRKP